jgi:hypothetical protein
MSKYSSVSYVDFVHSFHPDRYIINDKKVQIAKNSQGGESLLFEMDNVLFEIHKMTKSKSGGRNMQVVAWQYYDGHNYHYFKHTPGLNPQSIKTGKWRFKVYTNGLAHMYKRKELVEMAIDHIKHEYRRFIIQEVI